MRARPSRSPTASISGAVTADAYREPEPAPLDSAIAAVTPGIGSPAALTCAMTRSMKRVGHLAVVMPSVGQPGVGQPCLGQARRSARASVTSPPGLHRLPSPVRWYQLLAAAPVESSRSALG